MRRVIYALAFPIMIVGTAAYGRFGSQAQQPSKTVIAAEIPAPRQWIPFSADSVKASPGSGSSIIGRFHRASDGSTRSEVQMAGGTKLVTIKNVGLSTYYERSRDGVWCSHPMKLPPRGYRPPRMKTTTKGFTLLTEPMAEFRVYRLAGTSRVIEHVAPELNFFPLAIYDSTSGTRREYRNVTIGEQDPNLFLPDSGSPVVAHTQLRGLVALAKGEPELTLKDLREHR